MSPMFPIPKSMKSSGEFQIIPVNKYTRMNENDRLIALGRKEGKKVSPREQLARERMAKKTLRF